MTKKYLDMTQLAELVRTAQFCGEVSVDHATLSAISAALTERRMLPHKLALTIAGAITQSAGVALVAHGIPQAAQLAAEVGNNCAHTVSLILEVFFADGTIVDLLRKEN